MNRKQEVWWYDGYGLLLETGNRKRETVSLCRLHTTEMLFGCEMQKTGYRKQEAGYGSPRAGEVTDQSTRDSSVKRQLIAPIDMNT
ncbi:MAG: hypothetical protein HUU43_13110 [Ignavibacteriaceae bacterium]|nr:hypothetical protein [Ignavibacteriaceae bacterium]